MQFNNGEHGFDNGALDMKTIFRAVGPSFRRGLEVEPFESVHVYELLCKLLGIVPEANDGDPRVLLPTLADEDLGDASTPSTSTSSTTTLSTTTPSGEALPAPRAPVAAEGVSAPGTGAPATGGGEAFSVPVPGTPTPASPAPQR